LHTIFCPTVDIFVKTEKQGCGSEFNDFEDPDSEFGSRNEGKHILCTTFFQSKTKRLVVDSVADPGSGDFLPPGSGIQDAFITDPTYFCIKAINKIC
jgi:hypothetical protein